MKIAITIPTGRSGVKQVVKTFLENASLHNHNLKDFSIYLSIDTEYQNTKVSEFKLDKKIIESVNKVKYITKAKRKKLGEKIIKITEIDKGIVETLFLGNGYSKQRNSALLVALLDGNDFTICFDDDEAPYIPIKDEKGKVYWKNLNFFGPHLDALSNGADVTRGPYMGYRSPIPSGLEKNIPEEIRIKLGEALELGNDVITRYSFFNLINQIKYLPEAELINPIRPYEVENGKHGKHIYAGNMGINLNSMRSGKLPIFFTPPSARGEDTIFALQLKHLKVIEVNSFIFHDPFTMYPEIFQKKFPNKLKNIPITEETKKRFTNALIGWLKYAPILISMTSKDKNEEEHRVKKMLETIEAPTKKLADIFQHKELNGCFNILKKYSTNVDNDLSCLVEVEHSWKNKIVPKLFKEKVGIKRF